ncbi:HugZ family protein [Thioclava sp.]|uniref:HugZ family pyridoxamine 5'-phosphate oxidase n=1 Tax=Thioclava sp. TaxID=1933450 RepID=UPI003AA8357A
MPQSPINPIRPTNDEARKLARSLIAAATFGALAVNDGISGFPAVTRIATGTAPSGEILTLVSGLAAHTTALLADPRAGLLLGEPKEKGDPLTHSRLALRVMAHQIARDDPRFAALRTHWLESHPKSKLYIDLPDFIFFVLTPQSGALNGGFGRAWQLTASDLMPVAS